MRAGVSVYWRRCRSWLSYTRATVSATETLTSPRFSQPVGAAAITCTALAPGAMCTQVQPDRPRTAVARAASGRGRIGRLRAVRGHAIGRAACWERGCQYGWIWVVGGSVTQKINTI